MNKYNREIKSFNSRKSSDHVMVKEAVTKFNSTSKV